MNEQDPLSQQTLLRVAEHAPDGEHGEHNGIGKQPPSDGRGEHQVIDHPARRTG
jgi:hypothetical protein